MKMATELLCGSPIQSRSGHWFCPICFEVWSYRHQAEACAQDDMDTAIGYDQEISDTLDMEVSHETL